MSKFSLRRKKLVTLFELNEAIEKKAPVKLLNEDI